MPVYIVTAAPQIEYGATLRRGLTAAPISMLKAL